MGAQPAEDEALVDVVETSLVGPFPGLHELCWPGVDAGWLGRPRMKPRVCDGYGALVGVPDGKTFLSR